MCCNNNWPHPQAPQVPRMNTQGHAGTRRDARAHTRVFTHAHTHTDTGMRRHTQTDARRTRSLRGSEIRP